MRKVFGVLALILVGALGFWAGRTTIFPSSTVDTKNEASLEATVVDGQVGRTLSLNVTATRQPSPLAPNQLAGLVTQVSDAKSFTTGNIAYSVNSIPVRVLVGAIPFYRAMAEGDSGPDISQLNAALAAMKFAPGSGDRFTAATTQAVKAWQKKLGLPETGKLALGEVLAVPTLPTSLAFDRNILYVGAQLAGGEKVASVPAGKPVFTLEVTDEQAKTIQQGTTVTFASQARPNEEFSATTGTPKQQQGGTWTIPIESGTDEPVCGKFCGAIAPSGTEYLPAQIHLVKPVKGPAVPIAAVTTDSSGKASVQLVTGDGMITKTPVTVLGVQDGIAVVDGVKIGSRVRLGDEDHDRKPGRL